MSKIVKAINSMIVNQNKISEVCLSPFSEVGTELFFEYDKKYIWSVMRKEEGDFVVYYYPNCKSARQMSEVPYEYLGNYPVVAYGAEELGSKEAKSSVRELFNLLRQKLYNIDMVLDDIIGDDLI